MIPAVLQQIEVGQRSFALYIPDPVFIRQAFAEGTLSSPYWSQVWPSAIGLSLFLLQHTELLAGKKVLELGAGLGLPSIVAAAWAAGVLCTDKEPGAIEMVQRSAAFHRLQHLQAMVMDWRAPDEIHADIVLLSDVNYETEHFQQLRQLIDQLTDRGITVILSTPQRLMAKDFITPLLSLCSEQHSFEVQHHAKAVAISVLLLQA